MTSHRDGDKMFKCEICKSSFAEYIQAIEHKYFHSGEMPFKCEGCDKHFMFSWLLYTHRRLFHFNDLVELSCEFCNVLFRTKSGLRKHKFRKHSKVQHEPPLCDICGKKLASAETLKFHKRTHTGEKPHTCLTCGKSFLKKGLLIEHERIHTGEKPFSCPYCGKSFSQRAPLKIHIRIHTGERPYICKFCGKGCICKSVLDSHLKNCSGLLDDSIFQNSLENFQQYEFIILYLKVGLNKGYENFHSNVSTRPQPYFSNFQLKSMILEIGYQIKYLNDRNIM